MSNKLAESKSTYLKKHADNLVDWHPWGEEAFELARKENKPVLVSIGYDGCMGCDAMAKESFSDPELAALLNESFINIKVDIEEHPDVESVYMAAAQVLNGSGGWPLTAFVNHEREPFFVGNYYPKDTDDELIGLMEIVPRVKYMWLNSPDDLKKSADEIMKSIGMAPPPLD